MKRIMKDNKGFTLAELLIVVAIIAVLVAVSIPIFTSRLEKAREATDVANLRAAYAAGVAEFLSDDGAGGKSYGYDASQGKLVDGAGDACGKGTATGGGTADITFGDYTYTENSNVAGKSITVTITTDGVVTVKFGS